MSSKLNDIGDLLVAAAITTPTVAVSTNVTGAGVDLSSVGVDCFAIQNVGIVNGTSATWAAKIQEASTATGTYADIAGATFAALTSTTGINIITTLKFLRTQPFVRFVGTIGGTTTTLSLSAEVGGMKVQV